MHCLTTSESDHDIDPKAQDITGSRDIRQVDNGCDSG